MKTLERKSKSALIISFVIAFILISLGLYNILHTNSYYKNGIKVDARVENILTYPDSNDECESCYEQEVASYNQLLEEYKDKGIISKGTVVAIIVEYEVNGNTYLHELGYFSDKYNFHDTITIYVSKDDPLDFISENEDRTSVYLCLVIGVTIIVISFVYILIDNNNKKYVLELKEKGAKIKATVLYVDENEKIVHYNRHPLIFTCNYINEENHVEKIYVSESIYAKNVKESYIGKEVDVYEINDKYYVDVEKFKNS